MPSIPASAIVQILPNVIDAGGSGLDLVGLILTNSNRVPVGTVARFATANDVAAYFGPVSTEATLAATYFAGYDGSTIKPAALLFSQYASTGVAAYLRGGPLAYTVAGLQALTPGTISLAIDGRNVTSGTINLASATSYSAAAALIQTALNDADAVGTGSISGNVLTVTGVASGITVGQVISGPNITPGTTVVQQLTGTGGSGTYNVSIAQTVSTTSIMFGPTTVTYDSVLRAFVITAGNPTGGNVVGFATGTMAAPLGLTAATGAVTSASSNAMTPGAAMTAITAQVQNFASFTTTFKPVVADMLAFATWNDGQLQRYLYAMWDNSIVATQAGDTTSLSYQVRAAGLSGTAPIYDPNNGAAVAAFLMGAIASLNFNALNGRSTLAFRSGSGLNAGVTNATIASNLIANGYNFYGSYATANDGFVFFYPGQVTGEFDWIDSYVNQIWLNAGFQLALLELLVDAGSIPYNTDGYSLIEAAMLPVIDRAVDFGAIRAGITLSRSQAASVNAAAGVVVSNTLQERGWYVRVLPTDASTRAARGTPPVFLWYVDGQSIQRLVLSSVNVK